LSYHDFAYSIEESDMVMTLGTENHPKPPKGKEEIRKFFKGQRFLLGLYHKGRKQLILSF